VFCVYLRTNRDLCHLHHKLNGFYNRDEKCLQRGTNWVFKFSSLRFVFKGLRGICLSAFTASVARKIFIVRKDSNKVCRKELNTHYQFATAFPWKRNLESLVVDGRIIALKQTGSEGADWSHLDRDRNKFWAVVYTVMKLWGIP
jgi:hypothetical protein